MANCHKCKYEISAECVPRSQKLGYPNCYQSTVTNYDRIVSKTPEELAELFSHLCCPYSVGGKVDCNAENKGCKECWLDWLKQEEES